MRILSDRLPDQDLILTLNLTRHQLFHPDLITHLMKALAASGANPSHFYLEAPETAFNEDPDAAVAILQRLADWQVRVAIDDFGASLAPLNHLVHLPIGMVKLAPRLTAAALFIGAAIGGARIPDSPLQRLGLQIVAQGIET